MSIVRLRYETTWKEGLRFLNCLLLIDSSKIMPPIAEYIK